MRIVTYKTAKTDAPHLALHTAARLLSLDGAPVHVPELMNLLEAGPSACSRRHGSSCGMAGRCPWPALSTCHRR